MADSTVTVPEIRFYRVNGAYGWLSNLYPATIEYDHMLFPCSELAYQFGKFADTKAAHWAMTAPSATLCAQLAHALLPWQVAPGWSEAKVPRMRAVLLAKFGQHPALCDGLFSTGDRVLIEESNTDAFWGTGKKGTGKNMLGVLLMEVRAELRGTNAKT